MLNETNDGRKQRGLEIAATAKIVRRDDEWMVPSQSVLGARYIVVKGPQGFECTCPDFELRGTACKHAWAVEFVVRRETRPDGTVIETRAARLKYTNWSAYHKSQTSEKDSFCTLLRDLVSTVPAPQEPKRRGRPSLPLTDMLFSAAYKVYSTVSARRFMSDLRTATTAGFIAKTPHYNSIFNVLDREDLTPILHNLIQRSAAPLKALETQFAVDSTGFGVNRFYRHYSQKYGTESTRRDWLKMHATVGTKTNVIASVEVTENNVNDGTLLPTLVQNAARTFTVAEVSADKAYSTKRNLETVEALGAVPYIPFKLNADGYGDNETWNRLFHFFALNRDEFLTHYHRRSNVESTFSAMKRKFGETIRSKTRTPQINELLLKVLCHNLVCVIHEIHEHGVTAAFPTLIPAAAQEIRQIPAPAQKRLDF